MIIADCKIQFAAPNIIAFESIPFSQVTIYQKVSKCDAKNINYLAFTIVSDSTADSWSV